MEFQVLSLKDLVKGENPRNYFDEKGLGDLATSIKSQGVQTPIIVRPVNEGDRLVYQIIAGERRVRASVMAFGEEGTIPAVIRDFNDEQAGIASLIENIQRENMSATEESDAYAKVLSSVQGDKAEACAQLGVSLSLLEARLLLQHLVKEVKDALDSKVIALGHAELLSGAPLDKQAQALSVIREHGLTVMQTRELLLKVTQKLSSAIFPLAQCNGCPSNSETQASLLETSIGAGYCMNRECFQNKTEAEMLKRENTLKEDFPKVVRTTGQDGTTIIPIHVQSIGETQANACKSCASFGAVLFTDVAKLGESRKGVCFDAVCNAKKIGEWKLRKKPKAVKNPVEKVGQDTRDDKVELHDEQVLDASETEARSTASNPEPAQESESATVSRLTGRGVEYKEALYRQVVAKEVFASRKIAREVLVASAFSSEIRTLESSEMKKRSMALLGTSLDSHSFSAGMSALAKADPEQIEKSLDAMGAVLAFSIPIKEVYAIFSRYEFDLAKHWRIDADFLSLFTKSEIESFAVETGVALSMGSAEFSKASNLKKNEFIEVLMKVDGVDWSKAIPKIMRL